MILFILHLKKTLSLLQDLLRHSNNGLQCTYCVSIKNIHETNDVGFFDMFTYLVKDFKIVTITGNDQPRGLVVRVSDY